MTPRLRVLLVLVTAVALEGTLLDELRVDGVSVELLLLVAVLTGFHGGPERGAITAFFAGLLHDSIVGAPLGLHALVYPPLAVAVSSLELRMLRSTPVTGGLAVLAAVPGDQHRAHPRRRRPGAPHCRNRRRRLPRPAPDCRRRPADGAPV